MRACASHPRCAITHYDTPCHVASRCAASFRFTIICDASCCVIQYMMKWSTYLILR